MHSSSAPSGKLPPLTARQVVTHQLDSPAPDKSTASSSSDQRSVRWVRPQQSLQPEPGGQGFPVSPSASGAASLRHSPDAGSLSRRTMEPTQTGEASLSQADLLDIAIHVLSNAQCTNLGLPGALYDPDQLKAFFKKEITVHYRYSTQPLPDPERDDSLSLVRKCQALDTALSQSAGCTNDLLERALMGRNLPVALKMLTGLQQLKASQEYDPGARSLISSLQYRMLESTSIFYEKIDPHWQRLVLAAQLFDLNRSSGELPLSRAVERAPADTVKALLEAGARPDLCNPGNQLSALATCLSLPTNVVFYSSAGGGTQDKLQKLDILLSWPGIDPNQMVGAANILVGSALHHAVAANDLAAVTKVLKHPATNPDLFSASAYGSPLATAAVTFLCNRYGSDGIVRLLARQGASLLVESPAGEPVVCQDEDIGLYHNLFQRASARAIFQESQGLLLGWSRQALGLPDVSQQRKDQLVAALRQGRQEAEEGHQYS
ncbi:MAG: hypothetical protein OXC07_01420 [Kistimonas sp.]|nr:hypothetical protein [Kistimonas sp.]